MPETVTAPASVKANSVNSAPVRPPWKPIGTYTAISTTVIAMIGPPSSRAAISAASQRRLAFLLHVPVDVLDHDDGVVDHQPDREHQRQQRQQVDRVAEHQHHEERADQRQRHRDQRNRSPRASCRGTGRSRRVTISSASTSVFTTSLIEVLMNSVRVVDDLAGHAGGQLRLDLGEGLAHALGHVEDVGLGRHLDADEHRARAAEGDVEVVVLGAERDRRRRPPGARSRRPSA